MSRVYEALKKAESQRASAELRIAEQVSNVAAPVTQPTNGTPASNGTPTPNGAPISNGAAISKGTLPHADAYGNDDTQPSREHEFPVPESAATPSGSRRGPLLVVGQRQYAAAAEHFHVFSRRLQDWATRNDKRIFTVTSALSNEGKSFISLNLAASLARLGNRVILVDADLRASSLHHSFNLGNTNGVVDYLDGTADLTQCLHATSIPGLWLVPAGGAIREPAEALGGPRMQEFMNDTRSMTGAPYVIVDTPAASAVPEPQILARLSDALIIVVAANRTPRELVKQTIENASEATIFGIAFNRFEPPRSTIVHYPDKYMMQENAKL
jgi:capsular exopolysaccharide synthesis family protein